MNRIDKTLTRIKTNNQKAISPYITAGDPHPDITVPLMHQLVKAGADILELGIPFSDPMAEGPVIQHAMERALSYSVNIPRVLSMVKEFREQDSITPVVIMGYLNPIEQYGYDLFARDAVEAGVDGSILVDLPPEEAEGICRIWQAHGLYSIFLCSPTTSKERMALINKHAHGYLYYVSLKGVTGSDTLDVSSLQSAYECRKAQTKLPLMVGFGIKTPEIAAKIAQFADGVIVGAALITQVLEAYESNKNAPQAGASMINLMRQAIDNGKKNDRIN
jgi:tryptophan synthase alpha chain